MTIHEKPIWAGVGSEPSANQYTWGKTSPRWRHDPIAPRYPDGMNYDQAMAAGYYLARDAADGQWIWVKAGDMVPYYKPAPSAPVFAPVAWPDEAPSVPPTAAVADEPPQFVDSDLEPIDSLVDEVKAKKNLIAICAAVLALLVLALVAANA